MPEEGATPDRRIARIAARQHGVVSIHQLRAAGLSDDAVFERTRIGRLHRVHRGVYAVGHLAPSIERRWAAAVLALGDAVLSHRSAAALWRLLPPADGPVDVSLPGGGGRRQRKGIRIHRCQSLQPEHMTRHRGIPVTSPARTLADLRAAVSAKELRRAIRQADVLGLQTGTNIVPDRTRSELERRFLQLCRHHRLPMPAVNLRVGSLIVDFLWEDARLVVETDGYQYHRGKAAFDDDRARDLELRALGYEVARLSHKQVFEEPQKVAASLRAKLCP
jgi:very-short-patch-repair endonuclease